MKYLKVRWHHESVEEPVLLFSEIDENGWETRKVEEYVDGRRDLASADRQTGQTLLSELPIPALEDINDDPQFEANELSGPEFEAVWSATVSWFDDHPDGTGADEGRA